MAIYIHVFDTESAFTEAYNSEAYTEPWTSYTTETDEVNYNKSEECEDVTPIPAHDDAVMSQGIHDSPNNNYVYQFYGYRMCYDSDGEPSGAIPMFIWKKEGGDDLVASYNGIPDDEGHTGAWWAFPPDEESEYPCYFTWCGACPTYFGPVSESEE